METETTRYLLLHDNRVIASLEDAEPLRSIGAQLAKINGEHYHMAALTETIDPPEEDGPTATALQALHPWLFNYGRTASVQEIVERFGNALAEISILPANQTHAFIGTLSGILRGLRSKFSDDELAAALAERGFTNFMAWKDIQAGINAQQQAMSEMFADYNGDLDAAIAAWTISRDDRELLFVINQAGFGKSEIRQSAARWALNSLSNNPEVHSTLCRLGFTPEEPPNPF